jgi:hypothetical protein
MKDRSHPQCSVLRGDLSEGFFAPYNAKAMFKRHPIPVLILVLLAVCSVIAETRKMQSIPAGNWGGQHIEMKVGSKSATIEYDCATGVIKGPLVIDHDGNFNLRGTHRMQRGGPVRADETPNDHPATYTGSIEGNTMTLNLKVGDSDVETFTLEKGKEGELVRCK